jgi:hypothetical protein
MSFTNLITEAIDSVYDDIKANKTPTVCEMGNQRLKNNKSRAKIFNARGIHKHANTTKEYFEALGFGRYLAIDVNTEKDAVAMDLNLDCKQAYNFTEQFDLVTNNGTGEHVFNQYTVFKNIHDMTKVGGYMIHVLPFYRWVDHGFYSFHPNLFFCLAHQNDYEMHGVWIGTSDGAHIEKLGQKLSRDKGYRGKFGLDQWERDPMVVAIMKRKTDAEFEMPQQHLYAGDNISSDEIANRYK